MDIFWNHPFTSPHNPPIAKSTSPGLLETILSSYAAKKDTFQTLIKESSRKFQNI